MKVGDIIEERFLVARIYEHDKWYDLRIINRETGELGFKRVLKKKYVSPQDHKHIKYFFIGFNILILLVIILEKYLMDLPLLAGICIFAPFTTVSIGGWFLYRYACKYYENN